MLDKHYWMLILVISIMLFAEAIVEVLAGLVL